MSAVKVLVHHRLAGLRPVASRPPFRPFKSASLSSSSTQTRSSRATRSISANSAQDANSPALSFRPLRRTQARRSDVLQRRAKYSSFAEAHFDDPPDTSKDTSAKSENDTEHAVISTFDLFSIGIGPSSSHTVGPMRAGAIFVSDLKQAGLLHRVKSLKVSLFGSLALTGAGHHTPQALLLGLEGADCETVDTDMVGPRFEGIKKAGVIVLGRDTEKELSQEANFIYEVDLKWNWDQRLPLHSNGLRLTVFDEEGSMLATNDYYSIGGGFVVNGKLATASSPGGINLSSPTSMNDPAHTEDPPEAGEAASALMPEQQDQHSHPVDLTENAFYKEIRREDATAERKHGQGQDASSHVPLLFEKDDGQAKAPQEKQIPFPFRNAANLLSLSKRHNLTIAQIVYENERTWYTPAQIREKIFRIWHVMDNCIREGVHSNEDVLPGGLKLKRRASKLYRRLLRGFYPSIAPPPRNQTTNTSATTSGPQHTSEDPFLLPSDEDESSSSAIIKAPPPRPLNIIRGHLSHPIMPIPPKRTVFPAMDFLSTYAIAVNEVNAAGGRVVTSPTNGASGVIPAVLKYHLEFLSDDPERDIQVFLLTASSIGMLVRRGATISAAEGGCQAEVGVACSMAAAGFAAVLGATPETIEHAAEIGLEHNLGLSCDPVQGLVQAPCIERNALGAVKAVNAAQLAMAGDGQHSVSLDEVIEAMRETARHMSVRYKETSLGGLATSVRIPVAQPDC